MIWLHQRFMTALISLFAWTMATVPFGLCLGWSPLHPLAAPCRRRRERVSRFRVPTSIRYKERDNDDNNNNNNNRNIMFHRDINDHHIDTNALRVDTTFMEPFQDQLQHWMGTLNEVTRSQPIWVGSNILHISPSETLQTCLQSMHVSVQLFPSNGRGLRKKHLFDWDWKYAMVHSLTQQPGWNHKSWKLGASNTHPLRLQVVAIPPHTSLPAHVHPAVELDIPILGTLYEERSPAPGQPSTQSSLDTLLVDPDLIDRAPEHSLGTPLSDFSPTPTPRELQLIAQDISERVSSVHSQGDFDANWETRCIQPGRCLLNPVGSVHRSFTKQEPCLLFCLGPNVHAHFLDTVAALGDDNDNHE